jgi:hypothetical protein
MTRLFVDAELDFDVQLVLKAEEVRPSRLSSDPAAGVPPGTPRLAQEPRLREGRRRRGLPVGRLTRCLATTAVFVDLPGIGAPRAPPRSPPTPARNASWAWIREH